MATSGSQKKISKTRAPRVHITYDVELDGATKEKELPFVVGVIADVSGGNQDIEPIADRHFVALETQNLDKVIEAMQPRLALQVPNRLNGQGTMNVSLAFNQMKSFEPAQIARSVPALSKLLDARTHLQDLLSKLEGNEALNSLLAEVVMNTEIQQKAKEELKEGARTEK